MARRAIGAFFRRERGQALVEFALVVPVLVLILFGVVETGRMFNAWLVAANAAREGARVGAVQASSSEITARVLAAAPNLDPSKITVEVVNAQGAPGTAVTVRVRYSFLFIVPLIANLFPSNPYSLLSEVTMRLE